MRDASEPTPEARCSVSISLPERSEQAALAHAAASYDRRIATMRAFAEQVGKPYSQWTDSERDMLFQRSEGDSLALTVVIAEVPD